jgi:KDO2-lipid IV(A) lauroyltransferase
MWQRWMIVHKVVLQVVFPVLRLLPYRLAYRLLGVMGRLDLLVVPNQAREYEAAVAAGAERLGRAWDVPRVSRSLARQTYRWRVRDRLLEGRTETQVRLLFEVLGREHLDAALACGKGVILLANHFGSHVVIAHWMLRHGYPARWFGERPRNVSRYLTRQLRSDGPLGQEGLFLSRRGEVSESAARVLHAARVLNAGMVLMLASDVRSVDPRAARVTFLGREMGFATTWVNLAAITGAAVVPVFCRVDEAGTHHLEFHAPYHVPRDARRPGRCEEWVRRALGAVEDHVLAYPEQSNDYFFWGYQGRSSDRLAHAAPSGDR